MAEPQPSTIQEGAADGHAPTSTVEDRKAAAALQSLDAQDEAGEKKEVDSKALNAAMQGLSVQGSSKKKKKKNKGEEEEDQKQEEKKSVKIDAADVALLVAELELPKQKATELLRAHGGDAIKAMVAFVNVQA